MYILEGSDKIVKKEKPTMRNIIIAIIAAVGFMVVVYFLHLQGKETNFNTEFSRILKGPEIVTRVELSDSNGEEVVLEGEETIGRFFNTFWYMDMIREGEGQLESDYEMLVHTDDGEGILKEHYIEVNDSELLLNQTYYTLPMTNQMIKAIEEAF